MSGFLYYKYFFMLVANYNKMLGGGAVLHEYVQVYSLNAECTVLTPI